MAIGKKLNPTLRAFIERQHVFFVATAAPGGRVNVSPKGMSTLSILGDSHIRWLNLSGSGNETAAHLRELNRMTLMFCSFDDNPMILRVYGQAMTSHPRDTGWEEKAAGFPTLAGSRQIFDLRIDLVQTSCGSGVPIMRLEKSRGEEDLVPFYEQMGQKGVIEYWKRRNTVSIDGLATGIFDGD